MRAISIFDDWEYLLRPVEPTHNNRWPLGVDDLPLLDLPGRSPKQPLATLEWLSIVGHATTLSLPVLLGKAQHLGRFGNRVTRARPAIELLGK
jgi:hypothetical protein